MVRIVQIIEKYSGNRVAEYPVYLELIDDPSDQDYLNDAWDIAVNESLVNKDIRNNYKIEIIDKLISE
ncbi:MAG: hypothetical protein K2Q13_10375 [Nitrosomonas sp.]|uniref:hypothetical protein n=1 Tax=Nitrosomonas sp. TaxID=42353 RepID=UPI0025E2564F|nr:hypothetical protein [Nitrosomonas sp.]MBY0475447.1 hypothetical protein [Nitrosomonas sp.]